MNLKITSSTNGRTVGYAGDNKTAEEHLGLETEQHYNIQSSPSASFGDYSGDMAIANANAETFNLAAGTVDAVATSVRTYQDGRDKEEISKMYSDMGLFHELKMKELASDPDASADEKRDTYDEAMSNYKDEMLNSSKLTIRATKGAKQTFDVMTHEMKNKYATGQYQKDHISDYKGIQDSKFENFKNIAVSVAQDGDANGFMKVMNITEELDKDLSNPTFVAMYGDKAEEVVRSKQMDLVGKYFKSLPPELADQALENPDTKTGLVALFGEAIYNEFETEIHNIIDKKNDKAEREFNKNSADVYQQYNKKLIGGEYVSASDVYNDDTLNLQDQNRIANQIKVNNKKLQAKMRLNSKVEANNKTGFMLTKKEVDKYFNNSYPDFSTLPIEHKLHAVETAYEKTGMVPASVIRELDNPLSSDTELVMGNIQTLSNIQEFTPPEAMKLSDNTIDLIAKAKLGRLTIENIIEYQEDIKTSNDDSNNKRVVLPVSEKSYNSSSTFGDPLKDDIEEALPDGVITPEIKQVYLNVFAKKIAKLKNEDAAKTATMLELKQRFSVETADGRNRIISDGITRDSGYEPTDLKQMLDHVLPEDVGDYTLVRGSKHDSGKHSYLILRDNGEFIGNGNGGFFEIKPTRKLLQEAQGGTTVFNELTGIRDEDVTNFLTKPMGE